MDKFLFWVYDDKEIIIKNVFIKSNKFSGDNICQYQVNFNSCDYFFLQIEIL